MKNMTDNKAVVSAIKLFNCLILFSVIAISVALLLPQTIYAKIEFGGNPWLIKQIHGDSISAQCIEFEDDMLIYTRPNGMKGFVAVSNIQNIDELKIIIDDGAAKKAEAIRKGPQKIPKAQQQLQTKKQKIWVDTLAIATIKNSLRYPSTAEFYNSRGPQTILLEDNVWLVFGVVDSQNSYYGVTVRSNWNVILTADTKCDNYGNPSCWSIINGSPN